MPAHIVRAWGPSTVSVALDVLNTTATSSTAIARWAGTVGAATPEAAEWLSKHAGSVQPDLLRVLVRHLDPSDPHLRNLPPSTWDPVLGEDLIADAFVFANSLSHPHDRRRVLFMTFERLHQAGAASLLPPDALRILDPVLPNRDLTWDTCERLRRALITAVRASSPDLGAPFDRELGTDLGRTAAGLGGKKLAKALKLPLEAAGSDE